MVKQAGQVVGYARVSSVGQNLDRQLAALGELDRLFTDTVSGGSRKDRVGLAECLAYVREGDTVRIASMDRLARSLRDLRDLVDAFTAKGVRVQFLHEQQTYDAAAAHDPLSVLLLNQLGAFAEFERSLIRERQAEGIALAKAAGKYRGRPPVLTPSQIQSAQDRVKAGVPKTRIAADLGVSRATLYRALATVEVD